MVALRLPDQLATGLATVLSADVSATTVVRGRRVSERAQAMRARAYSQDGLVFLPDEAGPLDSVAAQSLIAHELTHLLQHQQHGEQSESTVSPDQRERQALAVEAAVAGGQQPPQLIWRHPMLSEPDQAQAGPTRRAATDLAVYTEPGPVSPSTPSPTPPSDGVGVVETELDPGDQAPITMPAMASQQALDELSDRLDQLRSSLGGALTVADDLDEAALARRLYGHLHDRLRRELILERERSGRLVQY